MLCPVAGFLGTFSLPLRCSLDISGAFLFRFLEIVVSAGVTAPLKAAHGVFRPLHVGLDLVGLFRSSRDRILHQIKWLTRRACFSRVHHGCTISQRNRDEKLIKYHMEHFKIRS